MRRATWLALVMALPIAAFAQQSTSTTQHKPAKQKKPAASAPAKTAPADTAPASTGSSTTGPTATASATRTDNEIGSGSGPTVIDADDGIEMQQSNKVYVAHGNATAKRGDRTLYGDTLMAFYRDIPNSDQTEIWRVVADGHVRLTTPTQTVEGDHAVYDLDSKTAVFTGKHLKLTTPKDQVTARDSLEWYDDKQFAVARGDAVGTRLDRRIRGDMLTAQISQAPGEASRISIVNGYGHVIASRPDEIGTGDKGVYNVDTGIVTLIDHVTLARGQDVMRGAYGVMDMQKGVSRLLPRLPSSTDPTRSRVEGYFMPKKRDANGSESPQSSVVKPAKPPPLPNASVPAADVSAANVPSPGSTAPGSTARGSTAQGSTAQGSTAQAAPSQQSQVQPGQTQGTQVNGPVSR